MRPLTFLPWAAKMAHLSYERVQQLYTEFGDLKVLDDVIRHRAADDPPVPILGYPRLEQSVDDYELFTGKTLDRYIDAAVRYFISSGFEPVKALRSCFLIFFSLTEEKRVLTYSCHDRIEGKRWPFWHPQISIS